MADYKPKEINDVTLAQCIPITKDDIQWNDFHMCCWICNRDDNRSDMMWNEFCAMYFHGSCLQ